MINVKIYKDPWGLENQRLSSCPHCGRKLDTSIAYSYCPECMCNFIYVDAYHPKDMEALQHLVRSLGTPWYTNWTTLENVMKSLDADERKSLRNANRKGKCYVGPLRHYCYYRYFICRRPHHLRSVREVDPAYQDQVAYALDKEVGVHYRRLPKPMKWKPAETWEEWAELNFGPTLAMPDVAYAAKKLWEELK